MNKRVQKTFSFLMIFVLVFAGIELPAPKVTHAATRTIRLFGSITSAVTSTFLTSGTSWTVPSDWNSLNNTIEVIGGGGGGASEINTNGGGGGGGGAYSKETNVTLTPGATVTIQVGSGGGAGTAGTDTYLCNSTSNCASIAGTAVQVGAKGGDAGTISTGGAGGTTASGVGTTKYAGGSGGNGAVTADGGGGGGAGGPHGNGNAGSDAVTVPDQAGGNGGSGDAGSGGAGGIGSDKNGADGGGAGGNGIEWDISHGSGGGGGGSGQDASSGGGAGGQYGAGGGGAGISDVPINNSGGVGKQGLIFIDYKVLVRTLRLISTKIVLLQSFEPVAVTYVTTASTDVSQTTYSWSCDVGATAYATKVAVIALHQIGGAIDKVITSFTVDGVSGTTESGRRHGMGYVAIPNSKGSVTVSVTYDSAPSRAAMGCWVMTGYNRTPADTQSVYGTDASNQVILSVPVSGVGFVSGTESNQTAVTTTNAAEDYDEAIGATASWKVGARTTTTGSVTVTFANVSSMVGFAFAPL